MLFREPESRAIQRLWGAAARDFRLFGKYTQATLECTLWLRPPPQFPTLANALLLQQQDRTHMVCEHAEYTMKTRSDPACNP